MVRYSELFIIVAHYVEYPQAIYLVDSSLERGPYSHFAGRVIHLKYLKG